MSVPQRLRVDHHPAGDALGIGVARPRLSWQYDGPAFVQTAYEVEAVRGGAVTAHVVETDDQVLVPWPFPALVSREAATVRVRARADGDWSEWSEPVTIEAGLLDRADWTAAFITPVDETSAGTPAPTLVGEIEVATEIVSARLYVTAMGLYRAQLNGVRVGDVELAPGWTSYQRRLRYQTYDVAHLLRTGSNTLELTLGRGWWQGPFGFEKRQQIYGPVVAGMAQLEVTLASGERIVLATDGTWATQPSTILENTLYDGQTTDLRPRDSDRGQVRMVDLAPGVDLVAPAGPPVRITGELAPLSVERRPGGAWRIDLGQNIVGWLRLRVTGPHTGTITVRHAEVLEHDELGVRPLRTAKATDTYLLPLGATAELEPCFTFHGFRYAEVTGVEHLIAADVTGVVIGSDLRRTGTFTSSHALLDRFHENVVWGMRGNFVDVPTDCPQRDERLGWTGDIQVFSPTAAYLFDAAGFLDTWLADLAVEQSDDGVVPWVVPNIVLGPDPATAAWGDAGVIVPWVVHEATGDRDLLRRQLPSMRGWVDHMARAAGDSHLWRGGFQFGDWLDPDAPPENAFAAKVDPDIVATACFGRCARVLAQACEVVGESDLAESYGNLADRVRDAFVAAYVTPTGRITSDTTTAYAMAICWGLMPADRLKAAGERLADLVRGESYRIATGFVGTPLVTDALAMTGQVDTAYRLLLEDRCPSWLYAVTMGATTVWERWDSMLPDGTINPGQMTSFNHYALGAVADWMHRSVAGLAAGAPGYRRIVVRPLVTHDLDHAETALETPYGHAAVAWRRDGTEVDLAVTVPVGASAEVWVPGAAEPVEVGAGDHTFEGRIPEQTRQRLATIRDVVTDRELWPAVASALVKAGAAADDQELARRLLRNFDAPVDRLAEYASPPFKRLFPETIATVIDDLLP
jgi:alpha-L-rhamnosidase